MAYLKRHNKSVLLLLAAEFDTDVSENNKIVDIIKAITSASDYDDETGRAFLERILDELKLEKEQELKDKEYEERERIRFFELEKLKLTSAQDTSSTISVRSEPEEKTRKVSLKDLVPKFDPKQIDISLFFMIFERQASREKLEEEHWVSQLIPLLPPNIAEIIVKEPADKADDFQHVKKILFKRFKLSATALKNKLDNHNRKNDALWIDLVYELKGYLDNWLETVEVDNFEKLKELILTEQLKKRVPLEIREHYLDIWEEINVARVLAEKCDKFEAVRTDLRKFDFRSSFKHRFKNVPTQHRNTKDPKSSAEKIEKNETFLRKENAKEKDKKTDRDFEKQREVICYVCRQPGHVKYSCPKRLADKNYPVNNVSVKEILGEDFEPYIDSMIINGEKREFLRDSGSCIDICESEMVSVEDLLPETVWLRQPLDTSCRSLPLAKVVLEGDFGRIVTKAALKPSDVSQGYYLMGNRTAALIEERRKEINLVNLVVTRSQSKIQEYEKREKLKDTGKSECTIASPVILSEGNLTREENSSKEEQNATSFLAEQRDNGFPERIKEGERLLLVGVSKEQFLFEQKNCKSLTDLWDKAYKGKDYEFSIRNERLVRVSKSKRGDEKTQLIVPKIYRQEIMELCHGPISGHLGITKTKDRLLTNFFWPNCYQEVENFVKTCDPCQKVGHSRDKKKAPLKLVPIISEPFRKLSIDAVGPLLTSNKGNRYVITALCLASKYPDAVPVENLESKTIVHALLQIFAKTGFPREIQCDNARSFTSELTTLFFDKYDIKLSHSSVSHPESTNVERLHSTLKRVIKILCLESGRDWEWVLPLALFALRTVVHESTGFSPAELIHGKNLRMPHTIVFENWINEEEISQNVVDYIIELNTRLKKCQDLAVDRMLECRDKRKLWYDKNAVSRKFKVGDEVLVLATQKAHKMAVSWLGPGVVTGVISDTNYTVDIPEKRNKNTIYHVNLLKPYFKRPEFVNLIIEEEGMQEIEDEASIPYPIADPNQFDYQELIKNSKLEQRITNKDLNEFHDLLRKHKGVFSADPGTTSLVKMDIILTDDKPVRARPYRMSPRQIEILRTEIKRLLELGVIEVGQSDYASPMILVESPGKDPRPCIDYRALNAKTRVEFFPLPNIESIVETVSSAAFISVMDLSKGYFQIELTERAQRYGAFVTPFGAYLPKKLMFGMLNGPFYFCKLMSLVLGGLETFALPYIDDIAIFSPDWKSHLKHLDTVLGKLREAGLKVKPSKCVFAQDNVKFLGHEVGSGKRSPSDIKIKAIQEFPTPKTKTQIRSFLGITGYYARYIYQYALKAAPLTDKLKGKCKREKIDWDPNCEKAFQTLKAELMKSPVLFAPNFNAEFIVQADASNIGAGIVLSQKENGEEHPIVYLSKKFSNAEKNYNTTERELAAIIYGLKKLNHYLDGQKFVLQTDHNPLVYLKTMLGTNSRLTRWALYLQTYNFTVTHKPGKAHANADALSRLLEE